MTDLNTVDLIGRLTRDCDFGYTKNGKASASLSVAVNRSKKVGENWENDVSFFDVQLWGNLAENLKPYLTKGKQIAVKGSLQQQRWEKDGEKKSRVVIIAELCQLVGGTSNGTNKTEKGGNVPENVQNLADAVGGEVQQENFPEDIPF